MTESDETMVEAPVVRLTSETAELLEDLVAITHDLAFVRSACVELLGRLPEHGASESDVLVEALFTAILVGYARCFGSGVRHRLTNDDIGALHLAGDPIGFSDHARAMRDKHVAHAVNPFEQVAAGVVLMPLEDGAERSVQGVAFGQMRMTSWDRESIALLADLATALQRATAKRIEAASETLKSEAQALPVDEVYALPPLILTAPGPDLAKVSRRRKS